MPPPEAPTKAQIVLESARTYENHLVPILFDPWGRRLLDGVSIATGQDILDVACGSGAVSRLAAARVGETGSVTGIDLNPGMIETAKQVCKDVRPPIEWHVGDATALPFEDHRFHGVLCQQADHVMPEKEVAIREMHRVLKPGGWAAFTEWFHLDHLVGYRVLCDALGRHVGPKAGDVMRTPFAAGDAAALRRSAHEAGFGDVRHAIHVGDLRFPSATDYARWCIDAVPPGPKGHLKAMYGDVAEDQRKRLLEEVERGLAPYTDDEGVVFPMATHVIVARKQPARDA